ncbi:hypothetical protein [Flavobacterium cerinum]|uniref:Uncharacterized protein n=1 Tax=Flavobacterium cerinum TaxID=2502784 RepID=A0A3S3Q9G4_9FLAO|nr:hypothetical protein [Flavobacterium cerinum]RWX00936.1 hypothetical protein EPI11_07900 [Flavobacterium cerinum]
MDINIREQYVDSIMGFMNVVGHKAAEHFNDLELRQEELKIAIPSYFYRNWVATQKAMFNVGTVNFDKYMGMQIVEGYEDKIVVYFPDWIYCPKFEPIKFEIPQNIKATL